MGEGLPYYWKAVAHRRYLKLEIPHRLNDVTYNPVTLWYNYSVQLC